MGSSVSAIPNLIDSKRLKKAERSELIEIHTHYRKVNNEWIKRQVLQNNRTDILATEVLGYEIKPFHFAMQRFQFQHPQSLQLAFRGCGKSTTCTITKCIHYLLKNPNLRILIASKTATNAEGFLKAIRTQFEENEKLAEIFGPYYDPKLGKKWDTKEIEVLPRTSREKEASITCVGVLGTIVSKHYDVIISDDLIDEDNSRTEYMRDKIQTWYYKVLDPTLEPPDSKVEHRGEHHHLGTRYHFDDIWGRLMENELKDHYQTIPGLNKEFKSPWPEKFPPEWFLEKRKKSGIIIFNSQYQCHSEDTEFLTDCGWKFFKDIKGEKLATYNLKTKYLQYQKPKYRVEEPYNGNLLHIKSLKVNALVTPNHQMICKPSDYPPKDDWTLVDASRVYEKTSSRTGRVVFPSCVFWDGVKEDFFEIKQGWRKDRHKVGVWDKYSLKHHGPKKIRTELFLKFLGLFISEGSTNKNKRGTIDLSQNEGYVLGKMRRILREMDFVVKEYKTDKTIKLAFYHIGLWEWLRDNVKTCSSDARIPREFLGLSKHQLEILFNALMDGDGHDIRLKNGDTHQYSSASKQLIDDISEVGLKLGYDSSISCLKARKIYKNGKEYMQKSDSWRICLRGAIGNGIRPDEQIKKVSYSGNVVCFRVENGTLITRRGGKILISGNCDTEAMKGEIFQYDDCQLIDSKDVPSGLKIFMGVDLAISQDEQNDHFAIAIVGKDNSSNYYVLDHYDGQLRFRAQTDKILQYYKKWDPIRCAIETNAYQKAQYDNLKDEDIELRLKAVIQDKDKVSRAWKLSATFEDGRMFFKKTGKSDLMIEQLVLFPSGRDDMFDALDLAVKASKVRKKKKRKHEPGLI